MIHRFYVPEIYFIDGHLVLEELPVAKQLIQVLRIKPGETIILFDQKQMEYEVRIEKIGTKSLDVTLLCSSLGNREPPIHVTLYQALLKKDKWEWLLQKVTELGVSEIVPLMTEHCIADKISESKRERYEKILIEATEQCGGCKIPKLAELQTFEQALQNIRKTKSPPAFLLHTDLSAKPLVTSAINHNELSLLIGPEGGFSPQEIQLATSAGIPLVSLGKRILRAETAGIIAVGLLQNNE